MPMQHVEVGQQGLDVGIINAKGFGGNNATATLLAPHIAEQLIATKYGASEISAYKTANEAVRERAAAYDEKALSGDPQTIYRFDYGVCDENSVHFSEGKLEIEGFDEAISLEINSAYAGLLED